METMKQVLINLIDTYEKKVKEIGPILVKNEESKYPEFLVYVERISIHVKLEFAKDLLTELNNLNND